MITRVDKIEEFLGNLDTTIDILSMVNAEDINSFDDLYDKLDDCRGFEVEIIYYSNAMEYLRMHDTSLMCSMEIAEECGYTLSSINSELLASLLASSVCRDEFMELKSEIDDFFDELEDDEEEEETEEEENNFFDWVEYMQDHYDYIKTSIILKFEEHYDNTLTFEENGANFLMTLND
jgi:hypothetical protein